jgi:hypothetical protein
MFDKMGLDMNVIVEDIKNSKVVKVKADELLPYPYKQNDLYYKGVKSGKFKL